jgi:hypothetical protein
MLPAGEELDRAVEAGIMFREPLRLPHDEWVTAVRQAARRVRPEEAGAAFIESVVSRRLDLRSVLGSLAVGRHLPEHEYTAIDGRHCGVCGLAGEATQDRNLLNFERFTWAGVRRDDLTYVALDLELFQHAPRPPLTAEATDLGRRLLDTIRTSPPAHTAVKVATSLPFVKGNKAERTVLLEILGVSGVLETAEHPGHRRAFVPFADRTPTGAHHEDQHYPLPWWRVRDGVNHDAVREWFPFL